jgi:Ca2+-binding EF-hand superfamily protein
MITIQDTRAHELFIKFDSNQNNKIEYSELKNLIRSVGWKLEEDTIAKMVSIKIIVNPS